jgi:tetratricopeptide (TPR) repeat protein
MDKARTLFKEAINCIDNKNFHTAEIYLDDANRLVPNRFSVLNNLAFTKLKLKKIKEAKKYAQLATDLAPEIADGWNSLGTIYNFEGSYQDALNCFKLAIKIQPDYAQAYSNAGIALKELGRFSESIEFQDKAITLNPTYSEANFNRAIVQLLLGEFETGWKNYEYRSSNQNFNDNEKLRLTLLTKNYDISGKTIFINHEQGFGDTLQFSRYLKLLNRYGANIIFLPQRRIKKILSSFNPFCKIVDNYPLEGHYDFQTSLLSLPYITGTRSDNIPSEIQYLQAEDHLIREWKMRLSIEGIKVGICWQGNTSDIDLGRSFPLALLNRISEIPNVRLISLHKGDGEAQLYNLPHGMKVELLGTDFDNGTDGFMDSAAVMKCCDLVISSDTAIAHLSAALGVETWLALKHIPDWRWLLHRSDSPWYPSVRLFRQPSHGDWKTVFTAIEEALLFKLGYQ